MKKITLFLISFLLNGIMTNIPFTNAQTSNLFTGLSAGYFFNEATGTTAIDFSGNGHDGTLVNGPIWTDGVIGAALQFDGVNDYVSIPYPLYSLSGGTLSLWFIKNGAGAGSNVIIGSWGGSGSQRAPTFFIPATTLRWEFGDLTDRDTGQAILNNQWYHVAMTYDSNLNVKVYLNGILVSTGTSVNPLGFYGQVHIGHYLNWGNHYFQGRIDEVLVWNRPLSPEEVTRVFSGEHPVQDSTSPSTPQGLTVGNVTENQISLFWSPSLDVESGVAYYSIYRNNETLKIGQSNTPSYVDSGLTPGHAYTYEVSAVNGVGLESVRSLPVSATTLADTTAPVISNLTISSITSTSATITWNTDELSTSGVDYGITAYEYTSESQTLTIGHAINLTDLYPGTLYHFRVSSVDTPGNTAIGGDSTFTTQSPQPIPGGLASSHFLDEGTGTTTNDSSGNGLTGTLVNGPLWVGGIVGAALQFDGVNDYVSIPYPLYSLSGGTLSLWFMKTGAGTGSNVIIGSWGGSGSQRAPTFFIPTTTLRWEFGGPYRSRYRASDLKQPMVSCRHDLRQQF